MLISFRTIVELIVSQLKQLCNGTCKGVNFARSLSIHLLKLLIKRFHGQKEKLKFIVSNNANVAFISIKSCCLNICCWSILFRFVSSESKLKYFGFRVSYLHSGVKWPLEIVFLIENLNIPDL